MLINCFYKIYIGYVETAYYLGYYTGYIFKESVLLRNWFQDTLTNP